MNHRVVHLELESRIAEREKEIKLSGKPVYERSCDKLGNPMLTVKENNRQVDKLTTGSTAMVSAYLSALTRSMKKDSVQILNVFGD